jgi:erythromycin esterase-like protein
MFSGKHNTWNLRDEHMVDTIDALAQYLDQHRKSETKLIVWGYTGTVTAAHDWDQPAQRMRVNPALDGSYEELFHQVGLPKFLLMLRGGAGASHAEVTEQLRQPRLLRAIGVIYRARTERISHYFHARLADQFDAMIHIDQTRAVEPLEPSAEWKSPREEETYPFGV